MLICLNGTTWQRMVRNALACPSDISSPSNRDLFQLTTYRGRSGQNARRICTTSDGPATGCLQAVVTANCAGLSNLGLAGLIQDMRHAARENSCSGRVLGTA